MICRLGAFCFMVARMVLSCVVFAVPAAALDLRLPATARLTVERNTAPDTYAAPISVHTRQGVANVTLEGKVRRAAWLIGQPGLTPLQVIAPLRRQLEEAGLEVVLDCSAPQCGGFDFRFAVETLPGPNMYVNIRAYHYVTALRKDDDSVVEAVTLLASTSATSAHVQIVQAGDFAQGSAQVDATAPLPIGPRAGTDDFSTTLLREGHVVLNGLAFETGSAELGDARVEDLQALARFLEAQPTVRVALVGHTDSIGSLDGNIALSRRRAQSVRQRLIEVYGVDATRMEAQGMGYLAPVSSNLKPEGRGMNRRVEVILLGAG